jgi:hypothetical protein
LILCLSPLRHIFNGINFLFKQCFLCVKFLESYWKLWSIFFSTLFFNFSWFCLKSMLYRSMCFILKYLGIYQLSFSSWFLVNFFVVWAMLFMTSILLKLLKMFYYQECALSWWMVYVSLRKVCRVCLWIKDLIRSFSLVDWWSSSIQLFLTWFSTYCSYQVLIEILKSINCGLAYMFCSSIIFCLTYFNILMFGVRLLYLLCI